MVENLVAIELAYINTKHPDFHKDAALVPSLMKTDSNSDPWHQPNNQHHHREQQHVAHQASHARASSLTRKEMARNAIMQPPPNPIHQNGGDGPEESFLGHMNEAANTWLANILPPGQQNRPNQIKMEASVESSASTTPTHGIMSPLKPVNLLPDVPINHAARKLTEKEQRDCDVIGKKMILTLNFKI